MPKRGKKHFPAKTSIILLELDQYSSKHNGDRGWRKPSLNAQTGKNIKEYSLFSTFKYANSQDTFNDSCQQ